MKISQTGQYDRRHARAFGLLLLASFVLFGAASEAQEAGSDEATGAKVLSLETLWNQAEVDKDTQALDHLLAETFIFVDVDGSLRNKPQFLSSVTDRTEHITSIRNESMAHWVYDNAVVATGTYEEKGTSNGKPYSHHGRFTDVWIRKGSGWLCAASQSTLIQK